MECKSFHLQAWRVEIAGIASIEIAQGHFLVRWHSPYTATEFGTRELHSAINGSPTYAEPHTRTLLSGCLFIAS